MILFLLGMSITINIIFVIIVFIYLKLKTLNPFDTLKKDLEKDIEDENAFASFFGGK